MTQRRERTADRDAPLGELLAAWHEAPSAIGEGRVFVAARRARSPGDPVRVGDVVGIATARAAHAARIVARRDGLLVAWKAAGTPSEPDRRGSAGSLVSQIAEELGVERAAVHAVTRLDLGVSGLVLLAVDRAAREQATSWLAADLVHKTYVGIATGAPTPRDGTWDAPVPGPRGARPALTRYRTLGVARTGAALLELAPVTGRFHQLRAHAAQAKIPLYGDRASGAATRIVEADGAVYALDRVALHAARLVLGPRRWIVSASPQDEIGPLWQRLGGDLGELDAAFPVVGAT